MNISKFGRRAQPLKKHHRVFLHKQAAMFLRLALAEVDEACAEPEGSRAQKKALAEAKDLLLTFLLHLNFNEPAKSLSLIAKALDGKLPLPRPRFGPNDSLIREAATKARQTGKRFGDVLLLLATQRRLPKGPNKDSALRRAKALGCAPPKDKPGPRKSKIATARSYEQCTRD
jgi:hypothetical protein